MYIFKLVIPRQVARFLERMRKPNQPEKRQVGFKFLSTAQGSTLSTLVLHGLPICIVDPRPLSKTHP